MPKPPTKNRKRRNAFTTQPTGFSKSLGDARNLISLGQNDQGLAVLNQLATTTKNPKRRAKILMLVGESQAKLSRHAEASAAYSRASDFARQAADLDLLLRSSTGQIRSLLRSLQTDEAKTVATGLLAEVDKAQQDYQKILDLTPAQLAALGTVSVTSQPPRPTVILTKIANAFIESGLTDDARVFLQKAVTLSPNGASRARQSLAKLALASDDPALAERYARESLLMGRFQAKTIPAWQLYLDARARQNLTPLLEPDVFASFQSNATARIASGSLHSIIRLLRTHGDPTWKAIAESAIASPKADPIISTEVEKIIQADAKLTGSEEARTTAARALRMFRSNNASAQEQVAHAKCYVRYSLVNDQIPSLDSILTPANKRFGRDHADTVLHAMALGAMQAGKHDTARKWLMNLLSLVVPGSDSWGKAMWAQARMESLLGKCSEAAAIYFQISSSVEIPPRFRMQSMLLGFKNLAASGDIVNLDELSVSVRNLLAGVSDYRVAFDAARQLALAGSPLGGLRGEAAAKGAVLADQALTKASNPAARLAILEFVARRQFWDLGDTNAILEAWSGLTDLQKSEMRIHGGSVWYQYCSIVMQSMVKMGKTYEAQALVSSIVDESHATSEGYVIMGSAYAEWLLSLGEKDKAFTYFQWISIEAPTHLSAASAHYWLSLRYLNAGQPTASFTSAKAVRLCFGAAPSLLSEWELDAKALLILTNLSEDAAINQGRDRFTPAFIHQMLATLRSDRDSIR